MSSADPYPYRASLLTTLAVLVGVMLLFNVRLYALRQWMIFVTYGLAAGVLIGALMLPQLALFTVLAAIIVLLGLVRFPLPNLDDSKRRISVLLRAIALSIIFVGLVVDACISLFPVNVSSLFAGGWIGNGLGSAVVGTEPSKGSSAILTEWGPLMVVTTILLTITSLFCGFLYLYKAIGRPEPTYKVAIAVISIGTLFGLIFASRTAPAFLTASTVFGSWTLATAIALLATVVAPAAAEKPKHLNRNNRKRAAAKFLAVITIVEILVVLVAHFALLRNTEKYRGTGQPIRYAEYTHLSDVSAPMQDATIAMEDHSFYSNCGFDWIAMHHALRTDIRAGRIVEGGSTITQQLAKNLFLTEDRTISRKIQEAAYTVELSHDLSKRRILELYLNTIDYGYGCHGITAAANYYFHETPAQLTMAQSAVLVGLVPDPPQIDPTVTASGEQQYENLSQLLTGEQTALGRMAYFFPRRYSQADADNAQSIPLERLIYPYKDAWDRGATAIIPAVWHHIGFYFFADPDEPSDIENVSPYLLPQLGAFLDDARTKYRLTGIDHLGVYNDRGMRQATTVLSAHAYGQAIDISGFRFANGTQIMVADHTNSSVLHQLTPIENLLKRHFDIVVDWRDDPLRHQTHFHCEVRGPRPQ